MASVSSFTDFKSVLTTLSNKGWMSAYTNDYFYVPDLRGIVPIGYGTNAKRTTETYNGGTNVGDYLESQNKVHNHGVTKGGTSNSGFTGNALSGSIDRSNNADEATFTGQVSGIINKSNAISNAKFPGNGGTGSGHRTMTVNFTPSGTVSVSVDNEGSAKQASKPGTIAGMWIVRFE